MTTATEPITEKVHVKLIYMGRRLTTKMKLANAWYDPEKCETRIYDNVRPDFCGIGTGFTFNQDKGDTIIYSKSYKDAFKYENEEEVAQWEIEDKAAYHKSTQIKLIKRMAKDSAFSEAVEPIKRIYKRLMQTERQTFILMLIEELKK